MATYQFVPEHNGIEIYFDVKPSEDVLEELRSNGWRWHRVKQCWFSRKNPRNEQFARTLCNESSCLKPPPKKESLPTEIEEVAAFNYVNSDQSIFSSVTITRKHQRYTISSTNNQITCCDCNRWISVHAVACPFCGCPQNYIIEHYFNKYNAQAMAEQKEREQKQLREQQKTEKAAKIQRIQQIGYHFLINEDLSKELNKLSVNDIQVAYNRANYLYSHKEDYFYYSFIMREEWLSLLTSSESSYQQQIAKLRQRKKQQDEVERQRKKQQDGEEQKNREIEKFRKYDKLRYYQIHYPQYGLSPERHMHLSEDQIREIIRKLSRNQ